MQNAVGKDKLKDIFDTDSLKGIAGRPLDVDDVRMEDGCDSFQQN